MQLFLNITDGV